MRDLVRQSVMEIAVGAWNAHSGTFPGQRVPRSVSSARQQHFEISQMRRTTRMNPRPCPCRYKRSRVGNLT